MIRYNPTSYYYKTPQGAVSTSTTISIRYLLERDIYARGMAICIRGIEDYYYPMERVAQDNEKDTYEVSFEINKASVYYYRFEIYTDKGTIYVGRDGDLNAIYGEWLPEWQLTIYDKAYVTPTAKSNGVIYHIFLDRFARVDTPTDKALTPWGELPSIADSTGVYRADDFFGGNLRGVESKLNYLKDLGVTILYLSPIYRAHSNHRYDVGDFMEIDPLLGTDEDFGHLCAKAKSMGIEVMIDCVFNHSGSDSRYFNKYGTYDSVGAYQSKESPYYDWYYFDTYPDGYRSWWGIRNVPTLNKENRDYLSLILGKGGCLDKWLTLGASDIRLDVADELPDHMLDDIRRVVKGKNKDSLIIGEVWENASTKEAYGVKRRYLLGEQLDGVMNYPFMTGITAYVNGGSSYDMRQIVTEYLETYPYESLLSCMTILDTHDTVRAINMYSGADMPEGRAEQRDRVLSRSEYDIGKSKLKVASTIQYMLPGIPSVYYGDEAGLTGWRDPLNRQCYPWGREDQDLISHYKALGKMRARYSECMRGGTYVVAEEMLHIVRYSDSLKLHLLANNSSYPMYVGGVDDIVSGRHLSYIEPMSAIVFEE